MRAGLYARSLSEPSLKETAQVESLRKFAKEKGITVVAEYIDFDNSRSGFEKLLARAEKGDITDVVAMSPDRLFRTLADSDRLASTGARLHLVSEANE